MRKLTGRNTVLRQVLAEGASTAADLVATLKRSKRDVRVGLWVLRQQGHVRSERRVLQLGDGEKRSRYLKLYELTPRGLCATRRDQKAARCAPLTMASEAMGD